MKKLKKKISEIKFTEEELKSLSEPERYTNGRGGFGQLKVRKLLLEQELKVWKKELRLETEYTNSTR